jgi:hypothetical protein
MGTLRLAATAPTMAWVHGNGNQGAGGGEAPAAGRAAARTGNDRSHVFFAIGGPAWVGRVGHHHGHRRIVNERLQVLQVHIPRGLRLEGVRAREPPNAFSLRCRRQPCIVPEGDSRERSCLLRRPTSCRGRSQAVESKGSLHLALALATHRWIAVKAGSQARAGQAHVAGAYRQWPCPARQSSPT